MVVEGLSCINSISAPEPLHVLGYSLLELVHSSMVPRKSRAPDAVWLAGSSIKQIPGFGRHVKVLLAPLRIRSLVIHAGTVLMARMHVT